MKIPNNVLNCVAFMGVQDGDTFTPQGTGFLVGVPYENNKEMQHDYLVTAKHNVTKGCNAFSINTVDGNSVTVQIIPDGDYHWYEHPSDIADICVLPIEIKEEFATMILPTNMFIDPKRIGDPRGITLGEEIFIPGLFSEFSGKARNHPIIRTGHLAMAPTEKVQAAGVGELDLYFIEARSTAGLSGSPVFVCTSSFGGLTAQGAQQWWFLLGLIQGHFPLKAERNEDANPDPDGNGIINAGIAAVTPASKIMETLMQEDLVLQRQKIEAES